MGAEAHTAEGWVDHLCVSMRFVILHNSVVDETSLVDMYYLKQTTTMFLEVNVVQVFTLVKPA